MPCSLDERARSSVSPSPPPLMPPACPRMPPSDSLPSTKRQRLRRSASVTAVIGHSQYLREDGQHKLRPLGGNGSLIAAHAAAGARAASLAEMAHFLAHCAALRPMEGGE